jgi:hypothetical protein
VRSSPAPHGLSRFLLGEPRRRLPGMGEIRELRIAELVADMRPPTDDDVPMTVDWEPLDTREKLVAYLEAINRRRETADGG